MASNEAEFLGAKGANTVFPIFYRAQKYVDYRCEPEKAGAHKVEFVDMVEIRQAGETDNIRLMVDETHKRRWPEQWAAYSAGREQVASGTPLLALFPSNPEIVEELRRVNIHTVEALAAAPDSTAGRMHGLTSWKQKASAYVARNQKLAGVAELEADNDALKKRLADLEAIVAGLPDKSKKLFGDVVMDASGKEV